MRWAPMPRTKTTASVRSAARIEVGGLEFSLLSRSTGPSANRVCGCLLDSSRTGSRRGRISNPVIAPPLEVRATLEAITAFGGVPFAPTFYAFRKGGLRATRRRDRLIPGCLDGRLPACAVKPSTIRFPRKRILYTWQPPRDAAGEHATGSQCVAPTRTDHEIQLSQPD